MPVAQLVEHLTFNQRVQDSSSCGRTKTSRFYVRFFLLCRKITVPAHFCTFSAHFSVLLVFRAYVAFVAYQSFVQRRGPHLHRPHARGGRHRPHRRGIVYAHPYAGQRLCHAVRCRRRPPCRHRHGPAGQPPGRAHHGQLFLGTGGAGRGADHRFLHRRPAPFPEGIRTAAGRRKAPIPLFLQR